MRVHGTWVRRGIYGLTGGLLASVIWASTDRAGIHIMLALCTFAAVAAMLAVAVWFAGRQDHHSYYEGLRDGSRAAYDAVRPSNGASVHSIGRAG